RGSSGAWQLHQFNGELVSGFVGASPVSIKASLMLLLDTLCASSSKGSLTPNKVEILIRLFSMF
ncbi:hypothetical protein, partial [Pseudomonas helleri]|uniref:hypothetical protein n=1 Tax=Pseudomonas helleri TaxID=1608996 RepID=UPI001E58A934